MGGANAKMDERRSLLPSPLWDYQWEKQIPASSSQSRDGELGQINREICLSQLIEQLDEINLRREEQTPKLKDTVRKCVHSGPKLPPSISKIFLPTLNSKCNLSSGSATCCSPWDPTLRKGQLQRPKPDLKCYKVIRSWSHHPKRKHPCIPRANQGDSSDVGQSEIPLRITPAMVTRDHGLGDRRRGEGQGTRHVVPSPYCSAPNRFECPRAGTSNSSSTGLSSSSSLFFDFPSDDSDLSDQERTSVRAQEWASPVEMDLRPDPFDKNIPNHNMESEEDQISYPEVLPAPLKILDLTQNLFNKVDWERRQSLITQDPSLFAFASRLVEMEKMQMATVLRERTKVGRSRSATAISLTRSTGRMKKIDFLGSQPEIVVPGLELGTGCPSVLYGLSDLTASYTTTAGRPSKTACIPSRTRGSNVNTTQPKQSNSSSARMSKTSLLSGQSAGGSLLNALPTYKVERLKSSKNMSSRLKRRRSCTRKKTSRPDRKQ